MSNFYHIFNFSSNCCFIFYLGLGIGTDLLDDACIFGNLNVKPKSAELLIFLDIATGPFLIYYKL